MFKKLEIRVMDMENNQSMLDEVYETVKMHADG